MAESKRQGLPSIKNFYRYIVRFGRFKFLSYIYSIILWIGLNIFFQLWCGIWVEDTMPGTDYKFWAVGQISGIFILGLLSGLFYSNGVRDSGNSTYKSLIHSVLRRPMSFFDTTSVGTIINRTVVDRENIDFQLAFFGHYNYFAILQLFSILVLVGMSSVVTFFFFVIGLGVFFKSVGGLLLLVNEFRKLTQIALGPVTSNIVECAGGIASLQAFNTVPYQYQKFRTNSEKYLVSLQHEFFANVYVNWKGEIVSVMLFFVTTLSIATIKVLDIKFLLNVQTLSLTLTAILQLSSWMSYNIYSLTM